MKKLIIIIILITAASSLHVMAQQNVHAFSIEGGGGLSTLVYQLSSGDRNVGLGGDFGLGYTFYRSNERVTATGRIFRKNWGIYTGVGLGTYHAKSKLGQDMLITDYQTDIDVHQFEFHTSFPKYDETQSVLSVIIPVMAQYQYGQYYFMGGFKYVIPINAKYGSKDVTLTNEAYYKEFKTKVDDLKFVGCGEFEHQDYKGKLDLGSSMLLALEGGVRMRLSKQISLFTGVYFDYGLSNAYKGNPQWFIKYDDQNPADFSTNSVLSLTADKVRLMAAGLKLRLTFER